MSGSPFIGRGAGGPMIPGKPYIGQCVQVIAGHLTAQVSNGAGEYDKIDMLGRYGTITQLDGDAACVDFVSRNRLFNISVPLWMLAPYTKTKQDRRREEASKPKCLCGNTVGVGKTVCSACERRAEQNDAMIEACHQQAVREAEAEERRRLEAERIKFKFETLRTYVNDGMTDTVLHEILNMLEKMQ